jgi:threonine dehydratase
VWETWRVERLLVEPAAACVLAALASGRVRLDPGEHAVAVVCGANVELDEVLGWCQPATAPVSHQLAG